MKAAEHLKWLRANGHDTAGLTGTDARALAAIAACWTLYTVERDERVLDAVAALLQVMQLSQRRLARALIPWAMDWSDEEPVFRLVVAAAKRASDALHLPPVNADCVDEGLPPAVELAHARGKLTAAQRDGLHCVRCGRGSGHMVPIGVLDGVQLFAHPTIRGHAPGCEGA